jgi:flagellar basal-body rod modification protein FlgD
MEITNNQVVSNSSMQTAVEQESLSNDDFLKLILTELKYQDPTKPMDTKAMIDQTMQMSTIEANNTNIKALINMQNSFASTQMMNSVNLIGKYIDTGNRDISLKESNSEFSVLFEKDVSSGVINILNENGVVVNTLSLDNLKAGENTFNWDGQDFNGVLLEDGLYTLSIDAKDSDNQLVKGSIGTHKVSALEFLNGDITIVANDYKINLNDIQKIW